MGYVEELSALIGHMRVILNGSAVIITNNGGIFYSSMNLFTMG